MAAEFKSVVSRAAPCKCCGNESGLLGVVDFNKNCANAREFAQPCGIPIYYHGCRNCGFVFTTAFDSFSNDDFSKWIYNDRYLIVDPDYLEIRPRKTASLVSRMCAHRLDLRILDYGCGNGSTIRFMKELGLQNVDGYDPFVAEYQTRPSGRYDLVLAVEVAEHTPTPIKTFKDVAGFVADDGMVMISTSTLPADFAQLNLSWWYIAPRNGHVSIYTPAALAYVAQAVGLTSVSFDQGAHAMWHDEPPTFIRHLVKKRSE
jgi:2-polyprenyl-6-hydroxyphenyl methylase/3-demethylubiquinone-9 3-methyltransferase